MISYAINQGVKINYQIEGDGPSLVLLHGGLSNLHMWYELGYVEALKNDYQLILIDQRGHGSSDKPHDPKQYEMEILAADIVAVLDDANIHKADFLGYSLAGRIGFGIAQYASKRFTSFMIGGAHPYLLDQNELDSNLQLFKQGIEAVIDVLEQSGMTLTPEARTQMLAEDAEAITALFSASHWRQSLDDALQTMTMPCLFFVGELDPLRSGVKQCADILPNATFICLPNCRHLGLMSQKGILLPHITHFLAKIS